MILVAGAEFIARAVGVVAPMALEGWDELPVLGRASSDEAVGCGGTGPPIGMIDSRDIGNATLAASVNLGILHRCHGVGLVTPAPWGTRRLPGGCHVCYERGCYLGGCHGGIGPRHEDVGRTVFPGTFNTRSNGSAKAWASEF